MKVRVGTRTGGIARAQSEFVTERLREVAEERGEDVTFSIVPVTAESKAATGPWVGLDQTGVLVAALRVALISDECDLVVHEMKDVPDREPGDLNLAAILERPDAREVLCTEGASLAELPEGARVAASTPRAAAQVVALRPGLTVAIAHGDVDAQIDRLHAGEYEALVLSQATIGWVKRPGVAVHALELDEVVPAAGQAALGIEIRADAPEALRALVVALDHTPSRTAVSAERAVLAEIFAPVSAPLSAHATIQGDDLTLHARVTNKNGTLALNELTTAPLALAVVIGRNTGLALLGRGAARLLRS